MAITVITTALDGVVIIEPLVREDERGFFVESYNHADFAAHGLTDEFVQDNHSRSARGVLRGIHYQGEPTPQLKLVRCTAGALLDVAVDLCVGSPTFGRSVQVELSAENKRQLWVPAGFGHAFVALADGTEIQYKCNAYYDPAAEGAVAWDDPDLAIAWPVEAPTISARDRAAQSLRAYQEHPAFRYG